MAQDSAGRFTQWVYNDAQSQVTTITDLLPAPLLPGIPAILAFVGVPQVTTTFFDSLGRTKLTIASNGLTTEYLYLDLQRTELIGPGPAVAPIFKITSIQRDGFGNTKIKMGS